MKQVFSLKLFVADAQKNGNSFVDTINAIELWAKDCDGLDRQQIKSKMDNKFMLSDEWFEIVEEV